jgi:hypothetical protein
MRKEQYAQESEDAAKKQVAGNRQASLKGERFPNPLSQSMHKESEKRLGSDLEKKFEEQFSQTEEDFEKQFLHVASNYRATVLFVC